MPGTPTAPDSGKEKAIEKEKLGANESAPARIVVNLPAEARLTIDGMATLSNSSRRLFVSPKLEAGKSYSYTFKAEFNQDGKPVVVSKDVQLTAGAEVNVSLFEDTSVASR